MVLSDFELSASKGATKRANKKAKKKKDISPNVSLSAPNDHWGD